MAKSLEAEDLGIHGHVFQIEEEDLLESLKSRVGKLSVEEIEIMNKSVRDHYISQMQSPPPIQGLKPAQSYRVFYFDPTICTNQDILDHEGKVIVPKGKCYNPLDNILHLDALLFFDATDETQVKWARSQNQLVKWVLTKGKPIDLEEKENRAVYFDQFGVLIKRFGIQNLPAKVSREGTYLKIEEFLLRS